MRAILLGTMMLVLGLGGCLGPGGELQTKSETLDFDGSGSGDHEKTLTCDADGQITGRGKVEDGRLRVTVQDADGVTKFDREYDGDISLDSSSLDGTPGSWTLRAERGADNVVGDDFRGRYSFTLAC